MRAARRKGELADAGSGEGTAVRRAPGGEDEPPPKTELLALRTHQSERSLGLRCSGTPALLGERGEEPPYLLFGGVARLLTVAAGGSCSRAAEREAARTAAKAG